MVLQIFRNNKDRNLEKRFMNFSDQLARVFAQIKNDISEVNHRLNTRQNDMEHLSQWIGYLHRSNQALSHSHTKIMQKHEKLAENHSKLHTSQTELRSNHSKTSIIAENIENKHQELSKAFSTHKSEWKSEVFDDLAKHNEHSKQEIAKIQSWVDYLSTHIDGHKSKEQALRQDLLSIDKRWLEAYSGLRELMNGLNSENDIIRKDMKSMKTDVEETKSEIKNTFDQLQSANDELGKTREVVDLHAKELENTRESAKSHAMSVKSELSQQIHALRSVSEGPQVISRVIPHVQPSSHFQRHVLSRVMPNKKGYVLNFIVDLVSENKYSTKELEEVVVVEKQLCGRTSFYAYLKELKLKDRIAYADIDERTILVSTDPLKPLNE